MPLVTFFSSSIRAIAMRRQNPESSPVGSPIEYIKRIRENYARLGYKSYAWVDNTGLPTPWTPLAKPLGDCRLALVASRGIYAAGQVALHWRGHTTSRAIPTSVRSRDLRATHFAHHPPDAQPDPTLAFP